MSVEEEEQGDREPKLPKLDPVDNKLLVPSPTERLRKAPRCRATAKRTHRPCGQPAVRGKAVCRLHGGKSSGPKTPEGKARISMNSWKDGEASQASREKRRLDRAFIQLGLKFLAADYPQISDELLEKMPGLLDDVVAYGEELDAEIARKRALAEKYQGKKKNNLENDS